MAINICFCSLIPKYKRQSSYMLIITNLRQQSLVVFGSHTQSYKGQYTHYKRLFGAAYEAMASLAHTYIIGHYNPSVRITAQLLTPLMLCALILYVSGGRFQRNFYMAGLFNLRVFARNLLTGSRRRNIFHISFLVTDLGYFGLLRLISRHITYWKTATTTTHLCVLKSSAYVYSHVR